MNEEIENPTITWKLVMSLKTGPGGWCRDALAYLGVEWPPMQGWIGTITNQPRRPLPNAPKTVAEIMTLRERKKARHEAAKGQKRERSIPKWKQTGKGSYHPRNTPPLWFQQRTEGQ